MERSTDRATQTTRSATTRRRIRSSAETRGLSGLSPEPAHVPRPRKDTNAIATGHPIMHWVLVTDENGRSRPEARWL